MLSSKIYAIRNLFALNVELHLNSCGLTSQMDFLEEEGEISIEISMTREAASKAIWQIINTDDELWSAWLSNSNESTTVQQFDQLINFTRSAIVMGMRLHFERIRPAVQAILEEGFAHLRGHDDGHHRTWIATINLQYDTPIFDLALFDAWKELVDFNTQMEELGNATVEEMDKETPFFLLGKKVGAIYSAMTEGVDDDEDNAIEEEEVEEEDNRLSENRDRTLYNED